MPYTAVYSRTARALNSYRYGLVTGWVRIVHLPSNLRPSPYMVRCAALLPLPLTTLPQILSLFANHSLNISAVTVLIRPIPRSIWGRKVWTMLVCPFTAVKWSEVEPVMGADSAEASRCCQSSDGGVYSCRVSV
jgi:hypothetical protein